MRTKINLNSTTHVSRKYGGYNL